MEEWQRPFSNISVHTNIHINQLIFIENSIKLILLDLIKTNNFSHLRAESKLEILPKEKATN